MRTRLLGARYELRYWIAGRETADVYAAYDRVSGRDVVVKVARDREASERLLRDAQALECVTSARVVTLHDVVRQGETVFLVLERIHGLTLEQELQRFGPICPTRACGIALDMLSGLAALRTRGLVLNDLKLSNVMIDFEDRAILLDPGVSQHATSGDDRVDLYRLGALIVHMTTETPIAPLTDATALARVPTPLLEVAMNALAPAAARYPSTTAMVSDVMSAMVALRTGTPDRRSLT
jgi:serine/threonine protein kinase